MHAILQPRPVSGRGLYSAARLAATGRGVDCWSNIVGRCNPDDPRRGRGCPSNFPAAALDQPRMRQLLNREAMMLVKTDSAVPESTSIATPVSLRAATA